MNTLGLLAGAALLSLSSTAAFASTVYDFTETFQAGYSASTGGSAPPPTVTGSFTGTASGNLITGLSNISVSLNGIPFNGSGNLFGSSDNPSSSTGFVSGGAVASFDGTQNNFLFIDSDYPNNANYTNFFYDLSALSPGSAAAYSPAVGIEGVNVASWSVTAVSPVPLPAALPLFGVAAAGFAAWGRRRAQKSA